MSNSSLPFHRKNYQWMVIGILIIALGFVCMSLDSSPDGYGFMALVLSPIVLIIGFGVEIFAILGPFQKK